MDQERISGNIVDLEKNKIFPGEIRIENGKIVSVKPSDQKYHNYILPGFIDAHVHIESSMLIPSEFARLAVPHGTIATVSDPHEIGNVLGIEGVRYMIQNGSLVPFHFAFGAPSCVPATAFETAGSTITSEDIRSLFEKDKLKYLSEMMNYPGVLNLDSMVMKKMAVAKEFDLPIDGHAPGLRGANAKNYIAAGISTDHECFALEEALEKIQFGMKILIREGSAAKNFEALHPLISSHPKLVMFCSDDKHPHELVEGHINLIVKRAISLGYDLMDTLRCACLNPIEHYKLEVGFLKSGQSADLIVVDNLKDFHVQKTYIKGKLVAENGKSLIASIKSPIVNQFATHFKNKNDFHIKADKKEIQIIRAFDGQLVTERLIVPAKIEKEEYVSDTERDILKLAVVNRYTDKPIAIAFINGFGLKKGALASCIAHDSHNIIAVGTDDHDICEAVNAIIKQKGGISFSKLGKTEILPLPIAGIMSGEDGYTVAEKYAALDRLVKENGSTLQAPFMTLSFMALLVIPSLKLSDRGLFNGKAFQFTSLSVDKNPSFALES